MRTMILAVILLLTSNLAIAVEPGVYSCIIDRMVGIQSQPDYHGEIQPNLSTFVVEISNAPPLSGSTCDTESLKKLGIRIFIMCNSYNLMTAVIPKEEHFVSDNKEYFYGDFGQVFHFKHDLSYTRFNYSSWQGFAYLEEGHCETFE